MDTYTITITGQESGIPSLNGGGLAPAQIEGILLALLAGLQREILLQRLGLPAFGQLIVAPPAGDGRR